MTRMYVTAYESALNFRSTPERLPGNRIGSLHLLQPVEVIEQANDEYVRCRADIGGQSITGFAAKSFLRLPTTPHREALLAAVHREYMRFDRGLGQEHVKPFAGYVGEMWKAVGNTKLDGTDRDQPWSAAAISFMVRNGGPAYAKFAFKAAHSKFVHAAIRARRREDHSFPFWGYRLHEARPQLGDIVVRDNPAFAPEVDFDVAEKLQSYRSHSDIIVHIDSLKQKAVAVGGNVRDSVGVELYDLTPGDFLATTKHTFALLRNIADGVDAL
jgi:hypothetical protein